MTLAPLLASPVRTCVCSTGRYCHSSCLHCDKLLKWCCLQRWDLSELSEIHTEFILSNQMIKKKTTLHALAHLPNLRMSDLLSEEVVFREKFACKNACLSNSPVTLSSTPILARGYSCCCWWLSICCPLPVYGGRPTWEHRPHLLHRYLLSLHICEEG